MKSNFKEDVFKELWMGICARFQKVYYELDSVTVEISPAISTTSTGTIKCKTSSPASFEWDNLDEDAIFSSEKDEVENVKPGQYALHVEMEMGGSIDVDIVVGTLEFPVVTSYSIIDATTDNSRDGKIIATIENLPGNATFLWTNGIVTDKPELEDVRPGRYSVSLLSHDAGGDSHIFIHACAPASVGVQRSLESIEE